MRIGGEKTLNVRLLSHKGNLKKAKGNNKYIFYLQTKFKEREKNREKK